MIFLFPAGLCVFRQLLPINQNQGLFSCWHHVRRRWPMNFALPDLRGRTPSMAAATLGERGRAVGQSVDRRGCPRTHVAQADQHQRHDGGPGR
ncbi:MAG: hypothetical protein R3F37_01555 [Candidatus Competibacteraceae bacterium]